MIIQCFLARFLTGYTRIQPTFTRFSLRFVAIFILGLFTVGCSSTAQWVKDNPTETVWQTMHFIDTLQTANGIAGDTVCFKEADPVTRLIVGEFPEKDRVYKWAIGSAVAHYFVMKWLDDTKVGKFMRGADTGFKLNVIVGNHLNGVRIDGNNVADAKCLRQRRYAEEQNQ